MEAKKQAQRIINFLTIDDYLLTAIEGFLRDRHAQGLSPRTIEFYREKLENFARFADSQEIKHISQLDKNSIRLFLLYLEGRGNNPGGRHAHYRAVKAFLRWWDTEYEPENWKNPISRIKGPRVDLPPLKAIPEDVIRAMVQSCKCESFIDIRDRAIILSLYDTGARASEFLRMDIEDVDFSSGGIMLQKTKNRHPRMVFLSKTSRRELKKYLRARTDDQSALWVSTNNIRLSYDSMRTALMDRAKKAEVEYFSPHAYRRGWALSLLRAHVDVFTLQRLGGWRSLQVMKRYLDIDDTDTRAAHAQGSPVEKLRR